MINRKIMIFIIVCLHLILLTSGIFAQRVVNSASGGSNLPEAVSRKIHSKPVASATPAISIRNTTDDEGCDPKTVNGTCPGTFWFLYGFNATSRPRGGGNNRMNAGLTFGAYIQKRVFVELATDNIISTKDPNNLRTSGYGDTNITIGGDILLEKPKVPSLALVYSLKVPTASASKGLGSGKSDHTIIGGIGKAFGEVRRSKVGFSFGSSFAGKTGGFDKFPFAAFAFSQELDKKGRFQLRLETSRTFKTSGYKGDAYQLAYLDTQATPNMSFRIGSKFGITDNLAKASLYFGVSFNGRLK